MPQPLDPRKKPTDVKVYVSTGAGVDITWADGHTSHYDFTYLREECPCAMCNDERQRKAAAPAAPGPALPMYKPKPTARAASPVGHYAVKIEFSDNHATGIYSFDYLREICPCDDCTRAFRHAAG